jgi:urea transport system permease protein
MRARSLLTRLFCACALWLSMLAAAPAAAQSLAEVLETHRADVERTSRSAIDTILADLAAAKPPGTVTFLERWAARDVWMVEETGRFVFAEDLGDRMYALSDPETGEALGTVEKGDLRQLRVNSGVRGAINAFLVQFNLADPDPARRQAALDAIARDPEPEHYGALQAALDDPDPAIAAQKARALTLLAVRFEPDEAARIAAIESLAGDTSVDARAALNPLVATRVAFAETAPADVARVLEPGSDALPREEAYALLTDAGLAPAVVPRAARKEALIANIADGRVAGVQVASLDTEAARDAAYSALVDLGTVPPFVTEADIDAALATVTFFEEYTGAPMPIAQAAADALASIEAEVAFNQFLDLALDGLSLASIYFLAAIGLAITFGVMRVINMAHGEFIMMGAYTGFVIQQIVPDYTLSLIIALPTAFAVTFAAGVAMERLVIRHLMHRPLETLLATFGISIALQQLAKNIFGTQAVPLTSPDWLGGALEFNDIVSISYIRIAIFVLALLFLALFLIVMNRTRLGLEVRAVTQNPRMAASMGINPDKINMLTFGLGSGIAGIAGVAIGLYAKVTSEMGADYIVQSFMTVVVGGVGNIWGTLLGATLVGNLQKAIEWLNPSNTLAAQTYMILFIILFIQIRPRGLIALKGRAAEA